MANQRVHLEQFLTSPLARDVLWTIVQNYNKRFGTHCITADEMLRHQQDHPEIADLWQKAMEEAMEKAAEPLRSLLGNA